MRRFQLGLALALLLALPAVAAAQQRVLKVTTPMSPPAWALLEREVLRASSDACREFYRKYFDDRGWLLCVERWGGGATSALAARRFALQRKACPTAHEICQRPALLFPPSNRTRLSAKPQLSQPPSP